MKIVSSKLKWQISIVSLLSAFYKNLGCRKINIICDIRKLLNDKRLKGRIFLAIQQDLCNNAV